jgi:hypothetical protein
MTSLPDITHQGRFDPLYAGFMRLRHQPAGQIPAHSAIADREAEPERRTTTTDPHTPWTSLIIWFLANFDLGDGTSFGYGRFIEGKPTTITITAPDGSWAEVHLADEQGIHQVAEGGPRRAWAIIEQADHTWQRLGKPGWDHFGLTVTKEHQQVWYDSPTSGLNWHVGP